MSSYNLVVLMGNLTRDPELRYLPSGAAVAELGIAVNRKWKDSEGVAKEEVSFFNCVAFGKTAETLCNYLKKGFSVHLQGRLKQESWEDRQTQQKRSTVKVIIESFQFLNNGSRDGTGGRSEYDQERTYPGEHDQTRRPPTAKPPISGYGGGGGDLPPDEDEVPFRSLPVSRLTRSLTGVRVRLA